MNNDYNNNNYNNGNNNYNRNDNGNNNNDRGNKKGPRAGITVLGIIIAIVITYLVVSFAKSCIKKATTKEISYSRFLELIDENGISSVEYSSDQITIIPKEQPVSGLTVKYYTGYIYDEDVFNKLKSMDGVEINRAIEDTGSSVFNFIIIYVLPFVIFWLLLSFVFKKVAASGGGIMGVGKSNAKIYMQQKTGVTFKDVAGQEEAKESVKEIVDFLHNPAKYTAIGAKLPKGALLVGPPGTGKTLLAKAVAGEAGVPFFSLSGSDFVEMFVGVGASRVRDLFKQAIAAAPCIIFIDEIDAIGKSRDSQFGGNDEREQTLNQLLSEMDGFDSSKGVLILAATNRPEVLDSALLRPGRFDRRVIVDRPDLKGREDILRVHAKNVNLDETVNFKEIALATAGAVGSDLANMVNEAAILAVKAGRSAVSQADLSEAVELVEMGKEKKNKILSKKEREIVSYHEVGHALVSALQKDAEPVQKITIVPRTSGALGYVMNIPEEEKCLYTKEELWARLVEFTGGRAAEEIVFGSVTTGASNDIEKATSIARSMITRYGMSEKFGLTGLERAANQYLDNQTVLDCSEVTQAEVDKEITAMLKKAYKEAKDMLTANRSILDHIAAFLIEKETITGKEFMEILRKVQAEEAQKNSEIQTEENSTKVNLSKENTADTTTE